MFFIVYRLIIKSFLIVLLTLSQISLYFSRNSLFFIKKDIFTFIKISSICTRFWKDHTQRNNLHIKLKLGFCGCETFVFQFQYCQYNFFIHFKYGNFFIFIILPFHWSKQYFVVNLRPQFY